MVIFENDEGKTKILKNGENIIIKPLIWHIHTNPYNEVSATYWDFDGDIREIIENIRKTAKE